MDKASSSVLQKFWTIEETRHYLDQCLEQNRMLDLSLRVTIEQRKDLLADYFLRLYESSSWDNIYEILSDLEDLWPEEVQNFRAPLLKKSANYTKALEAWLSSPLDEPKVGNFEFVDASIDQAPFNDVNIKIYDVCNNILNKIFQKINKCAQEKDYINLAILLKGLSALKGNEILECEKLWLEIIQNKTTFVIPENVQKKYGENLVEDKFHQLAESFLFNGHAPDNFIQRQQLARYLFGKVYIFNNLDGSLLDAYQNQKKTCEDRLKEINLEWINSTSDPFGKLNILKQVQCIRPHEGIVNFGAAYLELKNSRNFPNENPDDTEIRHLIQAEVQTPRFSDLRKFKTGAEYEKLVKYVGGLKSQISRAKIQVYFKEERYQSCLPFIITAVRQKYAWAPDILDKNVELFLPGLDQMKEDDAMRFLLFSKKNLASRNKVLEVIKMTSDNHYNQCLNLASSEDPSDTHNGIMSLYRSLSLGLSLKQAAPTLKIYRDRTKELTQKQVKNLSLQMGDVLGEAISKGSLSAAKLEKGDMPKGSIENRLDSLYDRFKDVMLQQNPYEQTTRNTLNEILSEAKSLIDEADSINNTRGNTVYIQLLSKTKSVSYGRIFGQTRSIMQGLDILHVEKENFIQEELPNGQVKKTYPEQQLIFHYTELLSEIISHEISSENNPLLLKFGQELEDLFDLGIPDLSWWKDEEKRNAIQDSLPKLNYEPGELLINDRFVISHTMNWIRFENEEALKVPFRKGMSVVCTHITEGIASCRQYADKAYNELLVRFKDLPNHATLVNVLSSLRKANYQINSLDQLKKSGVLPRNFDRSTEPRVRSFIEMLTKQLIQFGPKVTEIIKQYLPLVYNYDKCEFKLGMVLKDKEKSLKRYLHLNLEELTRSYLRESNRNSIPCKIKNVCLRVQQGINFRRGDMRNIRYSPFIEAEDSFHTPESILELLNKFEENFPIIDRITGSRQTLTADHLIFNPEVNALSTHSMNEFIEQVDTYLNNSQKLARQLRIIILPGRGAGSFEPMSYSLCIPLYSGKGRTLEMSVLSALADYLYFIKFLNEVSDKEEEVLAVINKKSKSHIKPGTHDSKIKITQLVFQEIGQLCGIDKLPPNQPAISKILGSAILGSVNTMIYRELRHLSAPQKNDRLNMLKVKYQIFKNLPLEKRIRDVVLEHLEASQRTADIKELEFNRLFQRIPDTSQFQIKEELYDLAVLLYHFNHFDNSFELFQFLTVLDPQFAECFWGLATSARHPDITTVSESEREGICIRSYRSFASFPNVSAFWKKRALDMVDKLGV